MRNSTTTMTKRLFAYAGQDILQHQFACDAACLSLPLKIRLSRGPVTAIALSLHRLTELTHEPTPIRQEMTMALLVQQRTDGAFGIDGPPDPLPTAAAIAALGRVVNQISTINSIEKVTYNRCQAAYEQGLASLAAMQGEDGLFGTADDCTDAERSLVSAFILYLLAGDPAFRMTIRFAELMNWFDERANQLDPMIIALWTLAGLDRRNSAPTIQAA